MKRRAMTVSMFLLAGGLGLLAQGGGQAPAAPPGPGLTLTPPPFADVTVIPPQYTQAAEKFISPKLEWTNVPANTVSFVLNMLDPDTALQRKTDTVVHWVVFNIPGTARELPENVPPTAQMPDGMV